MNPSRTILYLLLICLLLSGCKGCISSLYRVHEPLPDVNLEFYGPDIKRSKLLRMADEPANHDTSLYEVLSYYNGHDMDKNDRVYHFKKDPEEYYWVTIAKRSCEITAVYNNKIDSEWVYKLNQMDQMQVDRIGNRFLKTVLSHLDTAAKFRLIEEYDD
jgi:hypothetical protein